MFKNAAATVLALLVLTLAGCGGESGPAVSPTDVRAAATHRPQVRGESQEGKLAVGADLYTANCQACHGDREGNGATGSAPTHNETGHTWHHPDAQLKDWILKGKFAMPPFEAALSERDVDGILSYIKAWWSPEQRKSQAHISRRYQEALQRQQDG